MTGLPDDPSDRPTQLAEYGFDGPQQGLQQGPAGSAEHADSAAPDGAPEPWYRSRMLLALWGLLVALLLALVIYGIVELSRGGSENGGPATTTSSTATTPSSTATPTTTPSTSIEEAPPPPESPDTPEQTPEEAPEEQPPPANGAPAPAEPPEHHHHLPHIPSTITLPHTVITLPHGR